MWCHFLGPHLVQYFLLTQGGMSIMNVLSVLLEVNPFCAEPFVVNSFLDLGMSECGDPTCLGHQNIIGYHIRDETGWTGAAPFHCKLCVTVRDSYNQPITSTGQGQTGQMSMSLYGLRYTKRSLMSWVVVISKEVRARGAAPALLILVAKVGVIPKEGRARPRALILLLVWQRLKTLGTFSRNAAQSMSSLVF